MNHLTSNKDVAGVMFQMNCQNMQYENCYIFATCNMKHETLNTTKEY